MEYLYYPGCSLRATGRAYEESLLGVFEALDVSIREVPDWNCCGATAYMAVDESRSVALAARNLSLAAREGDAKDLVVPCAACYLVLCKAQKLIADDPEVRSKVDAALDAGGLEGIGHVRVRHPLDVLVNDIGTERVAEAVKSPLHGVRVACYYGCQIVRPHSEFDDQDAPTSMDRLLAAAGAEPVEWPLKTRCCGASLTGTLPDVGLRLPFVLLEEARARGADVVATACPLCQFNLECYQGRLDRRFGARPPLPAAFFTQLIGKALGVPDRDLGLQRLIVPCEPAFAGG